MKKVMYVLLTGLFCMFSLSVFSQTTGEDTGNSGDDNPPDEDLPIMTESEEGKNFKECGVRFFYEVFAANLPTDVDGTPYFPSNAPPMHLSVKMYNEYNQIVFEQNYPVEGWQQLPGIFGINQGLPHDNHSDDDNEYAFMASVEIDADLSSHCLDDEIDPWLFLTVDLITINRAGVFAYPVCDYTEPGELYSCEVFNGITCNAPFSTIDTTGTITFGYGSDCDNDDLTHFEELFIPSCYCANQEFNGGSGDRSGSNLFYEDIAGTAFEISVIRNPFHDQLQLQWTTPMAGSTNALIYDTNGKLLQEIVLGSESGQLNVNTSDWAPGLYVLTAGQGEDRQVLKLFKQ